ARSRPGGRPRSKASCAHMKEATFFSPTTQNAGIDEFLIGRQFPLLDRELPPLEAEVEHGSGILGQRDSLHGFLPSSSYAKGRIGRMSDRDRLRHHGGSQDLVR